MHSISVHIHPLHCSYYHGYSATQTPLLPAPALQAREPASNSIPTARRDSNSEKRFVKASPEGSVLAAHADEANASARPFAAAAPVAAAAAATHATHTISHRPARKQAQLSSTYPFFCTHLLVLVLVLVLVLPKLVLQMGRLVRCQRSSSSFTLHLSSRLSRNA
jgi:hypothetical protein